MSKKKQGTIQIPVIPFDEQNTEDARPKSLSGHKKVNGKWVQKGVGDEYKP